MSTNDFNAFFDNFEYGEKLFSPAGVSQPYVRTCKRTYTQGKLPQIVTFHK